jgi:hypothetical protein
MSRRIMGNLRALLVLCALAGTPRAHAFSDKERFLLPAREGGGDERLFTGSPRDAYTCGVCHAGGDAPAVVVYGLPLAGYVPGQIYDVEIAWQSASAPYALHVEIADRETGRAAGNLALLDLTAVEARARCGSQPAEERADYLLEEDNRQVLGVEGCGASSLRFRFTAPDLPQVVFAGSVVRSAEPKASPAGDGVQDLTRTLRRQGEPQPVVNSSCAAGMLRSERDGYHTELFGVLAIVAGIRARRRRRYKKLSASNPVNSSTSTVPRPTKCS